MLNKLDENMQNRLIEYRKDPKLRLKLKQMCKNIKISDKPLNSMRCANMQFSNDVKLALDSYNKIKMKRIFTKTETSKNQTTRQSNFDVNKNIQKSRVNTRSSDILLKQSNLIHTNFFNTINEQIQNHIRKPSPHLEKNLQDYKSYFKNKFNSMTQRDQAPVQTKGISSLLKFKKYYKLPKLKLKELNQNFNNCFEFVETIETENNENETNFSAIGKLQPLSFKNNNKNQGRLTNLPNIKSTQMYNKLPINTQSVIPSFRSTTPLRSSMIKSFIKFSTNFKINNNIERNAEPKLPKKMTKHRNIKRKSQKKIKKHVKYTNTQKITAPNFENDCKRDVKLTNNRIEKIADDKTLEFGPRISIISEVSIDPDFEVTKNSKKKVQFCYTHANQHKRIDELMKTLNHQSKCNGAEEGFFSKTLPAYEYENIHNQYSSYWMDCIKRLLEKEDTNENDVIGYYRLFENVPSAHHLKTHANLSVNSLHFDKLLDSQLLSVYALLVRVAKDLHIEHQNFIALNGIKKS